MTALRTQVRIHVLGPLVVLSGPDGSALRPVRLPAGRARTVLAVLALHHGEPVGRDRLIDAAWGERAPATAATQLQGMVSTLRRTLPAEMIETDGSAYRLRVAPEQLDLAEAQVAIGAARAAVRAGRPVPAAAGYRAVLATWRGAAFDGLDSGYLAAHATRLGELRNSVVEEWARVVLELGRPGEVVDELADLLAAEPLRESAAGLLMLALYRTGRQAAALATFRTIRAALHDTLSIEPDAELQELHRRMLTADPSLVPDATAVPADRPDPSTSGGAEPPPPTPPAPDVPRQLPAPPQLFTGRAVELAELDKGHDASTVVITAIDGMAGVGKTALAVQAAHQMVERYPDGQLFIDLHGYTQGVPPVEPGEALDRLLRSLGVPGEQIPADLDQRAGLYRSRLADRRVLIVLDNAATESQVTPLLPGAPGCLVLVTSRRRLAALDHTHTLSLDTLPRPDAIALLRRTAGADRLADQRPDGLAEAVELCDRLPLAIRIAAARLRHHPTWNLDHLVERLRGQQHRLIELAAGQRSVTAALDLSYQDLSTDLRRTYRLLGLHLGPDIEAYAAGALLDATVPDAGRLLEQLLEAHLLQERTPGRYRFHDLTRAHAATRDGTAHDRRAALDRLLDHYRYTAAVAMDAAYPYERERRPRVPPAGTPGPTLSDRPVALDWLDSELPNLLAAVTYAAQHDRPAHVLHLATILHRHLVARGLYHDAGILHQQALTTARATDNLDGEIEALVGLGQVHRLRGRYEEAIEHYQHALGLVRGTGHQAAMLAALVGLGHIYRVQGRLQETALHYQQALALARATGSRYAEQITLVGLAQLHRRQGLHGQATDEYQEALQLARTIGNRIGEIDALVGLGHVHRLQGRYELATDLYQQALQVARATSNSLSEQAALTGLGSIDRLQGRYEQATVHYRRLLDLAEQSGNRNYQFEAWQGLGRVHHATGHPDTALTHHRTALAVATELDHPNDQARAHDGLAHAHHAMHQPEESRAHWQQALDILTGLGVSHTDEKETTVAAIRTHLANLDRG